MEDLTRKLGELLNDPAALEQIKGLTGLLGQQTEEPQKSAEPAAMPDPQLLGTVMKIAPLLQSVNREDDSTRLLRAVQPVRLQSSSATVSGRAEERMCPFPYLEIRSAGAPMSKQAAGISIRRISSVVKLKVSGQTEGIRNTSISFSSTISGRSSFR